MRILKTNLNDIMVSFTAKNFILKAPLAFQYGLS
ncbi:hypothetical protein T01_5964 [Trichinella spiralis]|uniref:Uncharacterized protein n=1 Tax=Trichinella spiralis TaxID=6334 RepID=A0A0V0ZFY9_TRISP|nr:hypothetical protein T01_5964 [Trichinella spiralis]